MELADEPRRRRVSMFDEPIVENGTCKRCGRRGRILSNGYCVRCDDVLFGKKEKNYSPWIPEPRKEIPIIPEYPPYPYEHDPRRRWHKYWCVYGLTRQ